MSREKSIDNALLWLKSLISPKHGFDIRKNYHVGVARRYNPKKKEYDAYILQLRKNIDLLDCEVIEYFGVYYTSKKICYRNRKEILYYLNRYFSAIGCKGDDLLFKIFID